MGRGRVCWSLRSPTQSAFCAESSLSLSPPPVRSGHLAQLSIAAAMGDEDMEVEEKGGEGPRFVVKKW
eukprot:6419553-Prymnesium_polylepis.2